MSSAGLENSSPVGWEVTTSEGIKEVPVVLSEIYDEPTIPEEESTIPEDEPTISEEEPST